MKKILRSLALLLALTMLCTAALAEAPAEDAVLATVNGTEIMQSDIDGYTDYLVYYYSSMGYSATAEMLRPMVLQTFVQQELLLQKAREQGYYDQFSAEDEENIRTNSEADLEATIENWISSNVTLSETPTEEETATARQSAIDALTADHYTLEELMDSYRDSLAYERIVADVVKDAQVSDEEVQSAFDAQVASDKEQYADVGMYEYMTQYYGSTSFYTPEGYRGIAHILLEVDDALMTEYQNLQAALEEQQDEEEKTGEDAQSEEDAAQETATPVTQADLDAAQAAIIASVQPTIDEINAKLAEGVSFADLVAEYGTDPGMNQEPQKTDGYSVHMDSIRYDPAFVQASFSMENIGDVSQPYVGAYGVYICSYVRDVPSGPVDFTDEIKTDLMNSLLTEKENTLFNQTLEQWTAVAKVEYTELGNTYLGQTAQAE